MLRLLDYSRVPLAASGAGFEVLVDAARRNGLTFPVDPSRQRLAGDVTVQVHGSIVAYRGHVVPARRDPVSEKTSNSRSERRRTPRRRCGPRRRPAHPEPGRTVSVSRVVNFDPPGAVPNGCCFVTPTLMLVADSMAGQIWRVDLAEDGMTATARVWLRHDSMALDPDNPLNPQPGVNGVRFDPQANDLYYTSATRKLFMRIPVDPQTHEPLGEPDIVTDGILADDFCIDEHAGVAYVTTHRENTIDPATTDRQPPLHRQFSSAWLLLRQSEQDGGQILRTRQEW